MVKNIKITTLKQQGNDKEYWATKTPKERLEALDFLRQQYIEFTNAPKRLQRVLKITNLKQKS